MKGSKWSVALCSACVMCISSSFAGLLYEPSNYVAQDNLVLNFDGIRNAGLLKAHDNAAETWKNIGRAANDAVLVGNDSPANAWTADGYRFDGGTYGVLKYAQDLGGQLTIQIVCDVKSSENHTSWPTMFGNWNDRANIYYSDNLTTAMTGGQDSAGTNKFEAICRGLGVSEEHLKVVVPLPKNMPEITRIIREEIEYRGLSVIIPRRECLQTLQRHLKQNRKKEEQK